MFGLGMWEILVILALALIFIGPKKLPEIAQMLGKGLMEFRKATSDFKDSVNLDPVGDKKENKPLTLPVDSKLNIQDAVTSDKEHADENASKGKESSSEKDVEDDISGHLENLDKEAAQSKTEPVDDAYLKSSDDEEK